MKQQGFPDSSVCKELACNERDPGSIPGLGRSPAPPRRYRLPTPVFLGFPCGSAGKESACNVGDLSPIPGLGRSPGEGKGYPLKEDTRILGRIESNTTEQLSLNMCKVNKLWYIHSKEYYLIKKGRYSWCIQRPIWTFRELCWVKNADPQNCKL